MTTPINAYQTLFSGPANQNLHLPETRQKLQNQFSTVVATEHGSKWDDLWKQGFVPWDKGMPNPALVDLLESGRLGEVVVKEGGGRLKALVPGCGRGYDILLLSAFGYDAYGLDISTTALSLARSNAETHANDPIYATRNPEIGRGVTNFIDGDFFKDDFKKEVVMKDGEKWDGKFDLLYDYTFGCALPPSMRPAWSLRYSQLLGPRGNLICGEFPSTKPETLGGPPWALPAKVHMAHLRRPGENLEYAYDKNAVKDAVATEERWVLLEDKLKELEKGDQKGLVRVEHFRPERTHDIGYSEKGEVMDMISIWKHPGAAQ